MQVTTDNNCGNFEVDRLHLDNFQRIANVRISDIEFKENQNLLLFPHSMSQHGDRIGEERIFSLQNSTLTTGNIMGFIGVNESELKIQSRFAKKDGEDYFLHYMLQKVFSINMFDLKHSYNQETVFDFLLYLFPYYLKKALQQGLFKEYQRKEYNNANVKGVIDVSQHIRKNIPFSGNIAYRTKEYSYDNRITQLIRHTIEHISQHKSGQRILTNDSETQNCISQIILSTPTYDKNRRHIVLNDNINPVSHPFFFEYGNLQKICVQILRYEGLKYGKEKDKAYGLLFDGAWLWEEYLNTLLSKQNFIHPENKTGKKAIYLFERGKGKRYPDFWKEDIILDAKYKRLTGKNGGNIDRNDMHQIISYMYIKRAVLGGFICPSDEEQHKNAYCSSLGMLNGYGGEIKRWTISIPQSASDYSDYCNQMRNSEISFEDSVKKNVQAIISISL
jgi:5-methylcytosine-specific restriction endonuclease McrBC regulatory subunit McrC